MNKQTSIAGLVLAVIIIFFAYQTQHFYLVWVGLAVAVIGSGYKTFSSNKKKK